jgi:type IV pilus assembly protein PilC
MAIYPKIFKKLDLAIIKMGEQTGVLPKCLKKMATYLEWKEDLRAQIHKAIIYPAFIMVAITAVIGVWIGYVLPKMVSVLSDLDVTIPRITALLLSVSEFAKTYWFWFTGAALGMLIILFALYKTNRGILLFHQYLLKIPLFGEVIYNSALSRLCHNFTTMLSAGMAIQQIFTTLADHALGNRYLEKRLEHAYREIESGESIASAFDTAGGFPSLLIGAIRNGEETGTLEDVFKRPGNYFDGEVKRTVQALVSAIEPITILALGSVFGLILLSILLPLYDVMGDIGKTY